MIEELEGLSRVEGCDARYLVLVAPDDPKFDVPYYFIPLTEFLPRVKTVIKLIEKFQFIVR